MIDFNLISQSLPNLLRGAWVTLQIAAIACTIGLTLGTLLGLLQTRKNKILSMLVAIYVNFIRGTPMLIQIFFVFYVLPQLELGITITAFWAATLALGFNSSAYVSQIIRSGISSVSKGQIEAAQVLGLSGIQITRFIVLPQAFRVVLTALGNELVTLMKDSSLASIIGVMELTKEGSIIRGRTLDAITILFAVAVLYLILTTFLSVIMHWLEYRMNHHAKH